MGRTSPFIAILHCTRVAKL